MARIAGIVLVGPNASGMSGRNPASQVVTATSLRIRFASRCQSASRAWQKPHDDQQMLTSQRSRAELENDSTISGVSRNTSPEAFIGVARR